jgi:adenylate kinase
LKDNRLDDANEEVIHKRLHIYEQESKPVLTHYPRECITVIDATQPPAKVLFDILASVNGIKHEPAPAAAV